MRHRFPGKGVLNAVVDLPLALSPVVIGLALFLLYGRDGWLDWLPFQVLFSTPAMVLATMFVSLPFVVREVVPVLREIGTDQEQAAATLGAGPIATFRRVTLPAIRWAVAYGVVLTTARSIGEFGAVSVVSGRISGQDGDADAARAGPVRVLRRDGRVRRVRRARDDRRRDARVVDDLQAQGGARVISVRNVTKRFGEFVALDGVSVDVESGALLALLGPSGSGKSTLLRVIAGLERPDTGDVFISGREATRLRPQERGVGFVFQHYAPFKHMTVADNVAFGLTMRKRPKAEISARVHELLELVQLEGLGKRYPAQLSGGQRQRMALARALAVEPEVLLLDEPFGALDARVRQELREWLRRLHDEVHVTTVFVTHDQEEAMQIADEIVLLNRGNDRADRLAAGPLRAAGERVRAHVRRRGDRLPRRARAAARRRALDAAGGGRARGARRADRVPRLRGAGAARARRGTALRRAAHARRGGAARARAGADRLRALVRNSAVPGGHVRGLTPDMAGADVSAVPTS